MTKCCYDIYVDWYSFKLNALTLPAVAVNPMLNTAAICLLLITSIITILVLQCASINRRVPP